MSSSSPAVRAFTRLSTSLKILIVLSLALLPLGMIASLASLETAKANRANREAAAHLLTTDSAATLQPHARPCRRDPAGRRTDLDREGCRRGVAAIGTGAAVALFDARGALVCASRPLTATLPLRQTSATSIVTLDPGEQAVRLITGASDVPGWALAVLPRDLLARTAHPQALDGTYSLRLSDPRVSTSASPRCRPSRSAATWCRICPSPAGSCACR